jgi:hypothetical protein
MSTTPNAAARRVLTALQDGKPRTPAALKAAMPGATPVATIRTLLGELSDAGLVEPVAPTSGNVTAWQVTAEGGIDGRRAAALAEALPQPVEGPSVEPARRAAPARVTPPCEHMGCTTHARNVVRVTADGGVIIVVRLCQRHTLALRDRAEVIGGVR